MPGPHFREVPDPATEQSAAGASGSPHSTPSTPQEVQRRLLTAINNADLGSITELVSPDCVDHDPTTSGLRGAAAYEGRYSRLRRAFPDLQLDLDNQLAGAESATALCTLRGTHTGEHFEGRPASGSGIVVRVIEVNCVREGQIVERWGAIDEVSIHHQLAGEPVV